MRPTLRESEALAPDGIALLPHGDGVLFARAPSEGPAAESPVGRLLRGVHEMLPPEEALRAVRSRIVTSRAPTPACRGAIKVAGKRLAHDPAPAIPEGAIDVGPFADAAQARADAALEAAVAALAGRPLDGRDPEALLESLLDEQVGLSPEARAMALTLGLARSIPRAEARFRSDRPVAALLLSGEGRVLSAGVNAVARNRCLHAEANLVRRLARRTGRGVPAGARLFVTLEPCKMCAGAIWCAAVERSGLRVHYAEADPGPAARDTVLRIGSNERRAFAADREEREAEILERAPR